LAHRPGGVGGATTTLHGAVTGDAVAATTVVGILLTRVKYGPAQDDRHQRSPLTVRLI
jgi:hypothetical protein